MALEVEDGTGKWNAESVLSVADLDALKVELGWADWPAVGVDVPGKEAAARRGTDYVEARYGHLISGAPKTSTQRLTFPKAGQFFYPNGRYLPAGEWLPPGARRGYGEAIRRAYAGTLSQDLDRGGMVISESLGPLSTTYDDDAPAEPVIPDIEDPLRPLWWAPGPIQAMRA